METKRPSRLEQEIQEPLRKAVEHYGFKSFNAFFRASASSLIAHYKRGDKLITPLSYNVSKKPHEAV